jgi:hypothetical protein
MVAKRASAILAWIWFAGFCFCLSISSSLFFCRAIIWDNFTASLEAISGLYAPYLGVIWFYYFATNKGMRLRRIEGTPFAFAVAASAVWNLIVLGIFCLVVFGNFGIEDALNVSPKAGGILGWLVAPAIGYFFGSPSPDRNTEKR